MGKCEKCDLCLWNQGSGEGGGGGAGGGGVLALHFNTQTGALDKTWQEIYDQIETEGDMQSVENIYNDAILSGNIEVTHSSDTYPGKYDGILDEWIFASERVAGDRAFLETESGYYIVYMVSISENPEWYDRVNSFIRMRNYQAFLAEMESEYSYEFVQSGLDAIQDVP